MRLATTRDMDLTTTYLGLKLPHPIICGASPLSADLDMVMKLEDAGAAAIVMHSLFEEQIFKSALRRPHLGRESRPGGTVDAPPPHSAYAQAPGEYLEHLLRVKARVGIPIIASLNGTTPDGWLRYARALERAGADAVELNFYHVATDSGGDRRQHRAAADQTSWRSSRNRSRFRWPSNCRHSIRPCRIWRCDSTDRR